jgi:endo-1,4-beta-xylanase
MATIRRVHNRVNKERVMKLKNVVLSQRVPLAMAIVIALGGCGGAKQEVATEPTAAGPAETAPAVKSIREVYRPYFPVGAAVGPQHLATVDGVIVKHFNHLTAENDMKFGPIHPGPDAWAFENADAVADYARKHDMKMTGHTLIWHHMQPDWLFADLTPGDAKSIETLRERLKNHIFTVVERYADVIDNWDVVNEAVSNDPSKVYRDGSEDSKWYEIYGDETYVYDAFVFAKEALEKATGSAEGKLYYNDYNFPQKKDNIMKVVTWLRDEKGIPVDGVGIQAHWNLEWPSVAEIQSVIDLIAGAGFKVKISELDISVYPEDDWTNKVWAPEKPFDEALQDKQAARYKALFELFRKNAAIITSVTLWGVSDDATWLDTFPVDNRNNYPLLFDDNHQPKQSVVEITSF